MRSTYINEELQQEEEAVPNEDLENARGEDDDLFLERPAKRRKVSPATSVPATPAGPVPSETRTPTRPCTCF